MSSEVRLTLSDTPYRVRPQYLAEFDRVQNPLPRDLRILVLDYLEPSQEERRSEIYHLYAQNYKYWVKVQASSEPDQAKELVYRLEELRNGMLPPFLQTFTTLSPCLRVLAGRISIGSVERINRENLYEAINHYFFRSKQKRKHDCFTKLLFASTDDYLIHNYRRNFNEIASWEKDLRPDLIKLPLLELSEKNYGLIAKVRKFVSKFRPY